MQTIGKTALFVALMVGNLYGEEVLSETPSTESLKNIFTDAKVSGQLRSVYADYDQKEEATNKDRYATAIGGELKVETASFYGLNAAAAFTTSQDMGFATGDKDRSENNNELSSSAGNYTQLSQAYINYTYDTFNFRGGRQTIDTPLADSDDIRMIANTFEAYIATVTFSDFTFMAGNLQQWQGVDADLDAAWVKTAEDGTWFGGVTYGGAFNLSAWVYNITQMSNALYADIDFSYEIAEELSFLAALQYLHESELDDSGVEAEIFGAKAEVSLYGIGLSLAYNKAEKKEGKESFSGFGGGTLFTNMDMMILDEITIDREASALVGGISYALGDINFFYFYGDFIGKADSAAEKAHRVEQNMGFEYTIDETFVAALMYGIQEDKEATALNENDWSRLQVTLNYTF